MLNLPNFLSVFRIFLVPLMIWLVISGEFQLAFFTFILAGVTDAVDGFLAKHFAWETELGAYLDPLADKALLVSAYAVLGALGHVPAWLVIAVISRDILIIAGIVLAWMLERPMAVHPLMISKANTAGQILLAALVLGDLGFSLGLDTARNYMVVCVGILTLLSAAAYLFTWLRHMAHFETPSTYEGSQQRRRAGGRNDASGERREEEA